MASESNQREFTRVSSGMEVDLEFIDGTEISGLLQNISMRGLFVPSDRSVPVGTSCTVVLHLGGRGRGLTLEAKGEVARAEEGGIGVRFDEISYEAFQHLQNIVRFSSGDPDVIESEMDSHIGLHPLD